MRKGQLRPLWVDHCTHPPAEGLQEDLSSHHVDGHVHPTAARQPPHGLLQAALAVVHAALRAPLHRQLALVIASGRSDYLHKEHKVQDGQNMLQEEHTPSPQPAAKVLVTDTSTSLLPKHQPEST